MKNTNQNNMTAIGIELGSTRIKAVMIDAGGKVIASGEHGWENRYENGLWTYSLEDARAGVQSCYKSLKEDYYKKYNKTLTGADALGVSAMMHGYLVFGKDGNLLTPFRTWRNNNADAAAEELSRAVNYRVPGRWSSSHFYHAVKSKEAHVKDIALLTTLEGYMHKLLSGENVLGIGEASGMFPVDTDKKQFDSARMEIFENLLKPYGLPFKFADILPRVLVAGQNAGYLTKEGALFLDPEGDLQSGIPMCPPEGDAGTGMVATNSVRKGTGNVSAGTSIFSMIVLERELSCVRPEVDILTTPAGDLVAMAHGNNCTSEINAWMDMFCEINALTGAKTTKGEMYEKLFTEALSADPDCSGLVVYNYTSNESVIAVDKGRPMMVRTTDTKFNLANFMRAQLYSAFAVLKIGMDILTKEEGIKVSEICGHGGIFKTKGVAEKFLAAALRCPVTVYATSNEGGPYGIALLAMYMRSGSKKTLADYLDDEVFAGAEIRRTEPDEKDILGMDEFLKNYIACLPAVRQTVEALKDKGN